MKPIWIILISCLVLVACKHQSAVNTSDVTATQIKAVMQTLTAQAVPPTANYETAIAQAVAQTEAAKAALQTAIAQGIVQTMAAMPATQTPQPTQTPCKCPTVECATATPTTPCNCPTAECPTATTPTPIVSPTATGPGIMFTKVPDIGSADVVEGRVEGVNPDDYVVALYIRVGGGWWTKPTFANPTCPISGDGTWSCPYATGGEDTSATAIRAYLIPIGYNPPAARGDSNLPSDLTRRAFPYVERIRQP